MEAFRHKTNKPNSHLRGLISVFMRGSRLNYKYRAEHYERFSGESLVHFLLALPSSVMVAAPEDLRE